MSGKPYSDLLSMYIPRMLYSLFRFRNPLLVTISEQEPSLSLLQLPNQLVQISHGRLSKSSCRGMQPAVPRL